MKALLPEMLFEVFRERENNIFRQDVYVNRSKFFTQLEQLLSRFVVFLLRHLKQQNSDFIVQLKMAILSLRSTTQCLSLSNRQGI